MKLSVIVPLYNAEEYIERCLDSILMQQGVDDEFEVIVVDDHGQDGSVNVVERMQRSHDRGGCIRLIATEKNSGAWAARNLGMEHASGDWIGFVDADDWCEADMYARLIYAAESIEADWGYCQARKEFVNGGSEILIQPDMKSGIITADMRRCMLTRGVAYFWTGIYRRDFLTVNGIQFPQGKFSEDSYFWWMTVMCSHRIAVVDEPMYHYRIQDNSVSKRPDSTKAEQKQRMYGLLLADLRQRGLYYDYKEELDYLYIKKGVLIPLIIKAVNCPDTTKNEYRSFFERKTEKHGVSVMNNIYYKRDFRIRLLYRIFVVCPKIMSWVLRLKYEGDPF